MGTTATIAIALFSLILGGCGLSSESEGPNVVWIVWDTVRADRLSLYGHQTRTTPFLDGFAKDALVFDNCQSIASTTVPAHASLLTNLTPSQHGADNTHCYLNDQLLTLAEIFQGAGYRTFMYAENPYISPQTGFGQGFDQVVNPWQRKYRETTARKLFEKIPTRFRHPQWLQSLLSPNITMWALSAIGGLGEETLIEWLEDGDGGRPFFAFLNYMEAHQPIITPENIRLALMNRNQVEESYRKVINPPQQWLYTFGHHELGPGQLAHHQATYDAALRELDGLLQSLVEELKERGLLDNTIVVISSDHGEHLGEHHLLDHQYSLYRELLEVPLVLHYPQGVPAGRENRPVMNIDLFPTLIELAGIEAPPATEQETQLGPRLSRSLLQPAETRTRVAEYPTAADAPMEVVTHLKPGIDTAPFERGLRSILREPHKLIAASDGSVSLFDLGRDPGEETNLAESAPQLAAELLGELDSLLTVPGGATPVPAPLEAMSEQQRRILESLGYIHRSSRPADK